MDQQECLLFGRQGRQHHRSKMIEATATTTTRSAKARVANRSCARFSTLNQHWSPKAASTKSIATVIFYTILIALPTTVILLGSSNTGKVGAVAPTIDYSHNMRFLKLPHSTPVGSLIYRLKGSDGDPHSQLVFGLAGIIGRALVDVVPVAHSWNEADVFLRAPLDEPQYNLTIYVTDGNKTTQVESTILVTIDDSTNNSNGNDSGPDSGREQVVTNGGAGGDLLSPFLNTKHVFNVPENTKLAETIGYVIVRESANSDLPVRFELRGKGSDKFSLKYVFGPKGQSKAELTLAQPVDYERQNLFNLKVLALNAWTNTRLDTRNVATMDIVITVGDVQDSAPVFKGLPRSLKLTNTMKAGDVLLKVEAEDGDYGDQRPINYALDASSPLTVYFDIDKSSGEIKLIKSVGELALHAAAGAWDSAGSWSVLTIYASEVPDTSSYDHLWPPMYAKAELPLILVDVINEPPQFIGGWQTSDSRQGTRILHGYLAEPPAANCAGGGGPISDDQQVAAGGVLLPQPIIVRWFTNSSASSSSQLVDNLSKAMNGRPSVLDLGLGSNGTFQLTLEGQDAHLFQLEPNFPVTKQTIFSLSLADNVNRSIFDHDHQQHSSFSKQQRQRPQKTFSVDIVASDFGSPHPMSSRIKCLIELLDVNDNSPKFDTDLYSFSVYENAPIGQVLGTVHARDPDSGSSGRVKYTSLTGFDSQLFRLDQDSGQVSLEDHLDREKKSSYLFLVEARDSSGLGTSNYSQLLITVLDTNDNAPIFTQSHYDAVLLADGTFQQPLVVRALDADEPDSANSQVAYEIVAGNQNDQFVIDSVSGVIYPTASIGNQPSGSSPAGLSSGKIANQVPQIPPILSEPIVPYSSSQPGGGSIIGGSQSGKVSPTTNHREVEETTWPPVSRRSGQRELGTGEYGQNRTVQADSHVVRFANETHSTPSTTTTATGRLGGGDAGNWPKSTEGQMESEPSSIAATNKTSHQQQQQQEKPKLASLLKLSALDTDQLPALDLLMSLDSGQLGEIVPPPPPPTTAATRTDQEQRQHSIETRSLLSSSQQQFSDANIMKVPPVTTLIVRAHDSGIPLRASTVKVNIYNQALRSRTVSVILNVTSAEQLEQIREAIEKAFASMTGSRATIESIDSLSDSSSIRVAKVKLAVPQHSLVDLTGTDFAALMNALDYHGASDWQARHQQQQSPQSHPYYSQPPTTITHYIATGDRLIPTTTTANITSSGGAGGGGASVYSDIHSYAIDTSSLERRLLIYIIIVGVCILALLVIWMIYSCSREDREVKIIEKSLLDGANRQAGSYRPTATAARGAGAQTTNKTYAKTMMMGSDTNGSPIRNNLAKTTAQQQSAGGHQQIIAARQAFDSSTSNANELLLLPNHTIAIKPDHYSMYNGQVWFEPSNSLASLRHGVIITGRRASSAPHSGGSLDSALHSAISGVGRGSASPSQRHHRSGGQFFPNTVGYMENIASLSAMHPAEAGASVGGGARGTRYARKRKVAPMVVQPSLSDGQQPDSAYLAPDKPPRLSVHAGSHSRSTEASGFAGDDLEAGDASRKTSRPSGASGARSQQQQQRRQQSRGSLSSRSSSAASFEGAETMVLDSDQELLGFDSTGTPIIATHTRSATVKPLIIDMLDNGVASTAGQQAPAAQSQPQPVVVAPLDTLSIASRQQTDTTATKIRIEPAAGWSDARKQQARHATAGGEQQAISELAPSERGEAAKDGKTSNADARQASADATQLDVSKLPTDSKRARDSQGDLLSELNERLGTRRQFSETRGDDDGAAGTLKSQLSEAKEESSSAAKPKATDGGSASVREKLERRVVKSANSDDSTGAGAENLSSMKNAELLEKQSIFALTYSGLATDQPPAGC